MLGSLIDDYKNIEYLGDLEDAIASYNPRAEDIPALVEDLKGVIQASSDFIKNASYSDGDAFYTNRSNIANLLSIHGLIVGRIQDLGMANTSPWKEYIAAYNQCLEAVRLLFSVSSPAEIDAKVIEAFGIIAKTLAFPVSSSVGNIVQSSGTVGQAVVKNAGDLYNAFINALSKGSSSITSQASEGLVEILSRLIWPAALIIGASILVPRIISKIVLGNPFLMIANPSTPTQDEKKKLYERANRMQRGISESQFYKALNTFIAQHKKMPELRVIKDIPGIPIAVEIGKINHLVYDPPNGSRKKPFTYKHEMPSTHLVADPDGRHLTLLGNTYLDIRDGWLKS